MAFVQTAKITRPDVRSSIKRVSVFEVLDDAFDRPVVWVCAPSGAGKTILVAGFLESRVIPSLWYRLDAGDADPATFFYYLALAAKSTNPGCYTALPLLTPEYALGMDTFAKRYFENLFIALRCMTPPGHLVLDDYQKVSENAVLHNMLAAALDVMPSGINVTIISRHPPPSSFARLRSNNRLAIVDWESIKFSRREAGELIEGTPVPLPDTQRQRPSGQKQATTTRESRTRKKHDAITDRLHQVAGGWAAGLVLLTERFKSDETSLSRLTTPYTREEIVACFAEEVYSAVDKKTQDFLIRTCLLSQMTPHTAAAISGNKQAGRILDGLNHRNCFTEKRLLHPFVYQYHPSFRTFLRSRAQEQLSPDEFQQLKRNAANLLAESGDTDTAIELHLNSGGYAAAARLILHQAPVMIGAGRSNTLDDWLQRLPVVLRTELPWLSYWMGVCRCLFSPDTALGLFQTAFHRFRAQGNEEGLLSAWAGAVDAILLARNDFLQLDFWVEWLETHMEDNGFYFSSRGMEVTVTASMVGAILFRHAQYPGAGKWLKRAEVLLADHLDPAGIGLLYLLMYYLIVGDTKKSSALIEKLEPFGVASSPPFLRIKIYLLKAMHAHIVEGDGRETIRLAEKGLAIAYDTGIHVLDQHLLAQAAHGGLAINDLRETKKYLDLMQSESLNRHPWDIAKYHYLHSWHDYCSNNIQGFRRHIQSALDSSNKNGCTFAQATAHLGMALARLEMNQIEAAERHIALAQDIVPGNGDIYEFCYLFSRALIYFRSNDEDRAIPTLTQALSLGRKQSFFMAPFWNHEMVNMISVRALERNIEPAYISEIVRRICFSPLSAKGETAEIQIRSHPVRVFTLGRFEIEISGKPLNGPGRAQQKPIDLLKVLLSFGCVDVSAQRIAEALYPDTDGDRAHYSFKHTLHRLRGLLGIEGVLVMRGGRLSVDRRSCFIDSAVFLQLGERIRKLYWGENGLSSKPDGDSSETEHILELGQKAIDLYKGDFLKNDDFSWAITTRENLRSKFLSLVEIAGACFENNGRIQEAIRLYERSIEIDERQERFYRRLMRCYGKAGRRADALSVYESCAKILAAEMGIAPSLATKAVHDALLKG